MSSSSSSASCAAPTRSESTSTRHGPSCGVPPTLALRALEPRGDAGSRQRAQDRVGLCTVARDGDRHQSVSHGAFSSSGCAPPRRSSGAPRSGSGSSMVSKSRGTTVSAKTARASSLIARGDARVPRCVSASSLTSLDERDLGRLGRRRVPRLLRAREIVRREARLVHEQIGAERRAAHGGARPRVAAEDQRAPAARRPEHGGGRHGRAIRRRDGAAALQLAERRARPARRAAAPRRRRNCRAARPRTAPRPAPARGGRRSARAGGSRRPAPRRRSPSSRACSGKPSRPTIGANTASSSFRPDGP